MDTPPAGAVGPMVLEGGEALLEVAVEAGGGLPLVVVGVDGDRPEADHHGHGDGGGQSDDESGAPVDEGDGDRHTDDEHGVADELDDDVAEERGEGLDIPVDPGDRGARRRPPVPRPVEVEDVGGELLAEPVARPPRHRGRRPHERELQPLGHDGDDQVEAGDGDEPARRLSGEGVVNGDADQGGAGEGNDHGHDEQCDERGQAPSLRAEDGAQERDGSGGRGRGRHSAGQRAGRRYAGPSRRDGGIPLAPSCGLPRRGLTRGGDG